MTIEFHPLDRPGSFDVMVPKPGYARAMTRGHMIRGTGDRFVIINESECPHIKGVFKSPAEAMKAIIDVYFGGPK